MTDITNLCRPIVGIENRTAQEAFDIMADRIRAEVEPVGYLGYGPSNIPQYSPARELFDRECWHVVPVYAEAPAEHRVRGGEIEPSEGLLRSLYERAEAEGTAWIRELLLSAADRIESQGRALSALTPAEKAGVGDGEANRAAQITMGRGLVDVTRIEHEGRAGILFRPRTEHIPMGEPGELPEGSYWPVEGDVVIWIENEGGARVIQNYLAPFLADGDDLDARMKAAGMFTVAEMMGVTPMTRWKVHSGMDNLDFFGEWLDRKVSEYLTMKARYELGDKDEDDELYEWVLAHAGAFSTIRENFRAAREGSALSTTKPAQGDGE